MQTQTKDTKQRLDYRNKTRTRAKTIIKQPGLVFWEGPSLLDNMPLVVVCNGFRYNSENTKTGPMLQAYILRADVDPWNAIKQGADKSICGDCIYRARAPDAKERACYVQIYPWVTTVWHAYKRGAYARIEDVLKKGDPFADQYVRVGTYGDPGAVPFEVWERMLANAEGWTAYTHLWKTCDQRLQDIAVASVDSPEEYDLATSRGWRTFRTRFESEKLRSHEIVCPASNEAEHKAQCVDCQLCNGKEGAGDNRRNIAIIAHGRGGRWYSAARSSMDIRGQGRLPIVNNR